MAVFSVSYDLKKPGQDYTGLIAELKASPSWWHYLQSTWLIKTHESAHQLCERLCKHIDRNDNLLIIKVQRDYNGWLSDDAWDWINENVSFY